MVSGARRANGRHARAVADVHGRLRAVMRARGTGPAVVGAAGLVLTGAIVAFTVHVPGGPPAAPRADAAGAAAGPQAAPAPAAVPVRPARPARTGDEAALAYYEARDPVRAAHVTQAVWTGPMLRVYTDLPATDADSRTAIALCETAAGYAEARGRLPEVFVHADRRAGYQVLANKMDAGDDCRLGRVP